MAHIVARRNAESFWWCRKRLTNAICSMYGGTVLKDVINGAVLEHKTYLSSISSALCMMMQRWKLWWMELSLNHTNVSYLDVVCSVYGDAALKAVMNGVVLEPRAGCRVAHVEMQRVGTWPIKERKSYWTTVAFRFKNMKRKQMGWDDIK